MGNNMSCLHDNNKDNNINMNISYIHLTLAFHIRIIRGMSMYTVLSFPFLKKCNI